MLPMETEQVQRARERREHQGSDGAPRSASPSLFSRTPPAVRGSSSLGGGVNTTEQPNARVRGRQRAFLKAFALTANISGATRAADDSG